jgi:DNA-binding response OmpR family regulator
MQSFEPRQRVLCVDDNRDTCELIKIALGFSGIQVVPAYRASDGLRLAEDDQFALYVIDGRLPDASGIELCEQIRRLDKQNPIVFCSAIPERFTQDMATMAGAQAYFSKPLSIQQLVSTVTDLLGSKTRPRT